MITGPCHCGHPVAVHDLLRVGSGPVAGRVGECLWLDPPCDCVGYESAACSCGHAVGAEVRPALEAAQRETVDGYEFLTVPISLGRIRLPEDEGRTCKEPDQ